MAADLYAKEIDILMFELSTPRCSHELWDRCVELSQKQTEAAGAVSATKAAPALLQARRYNGVAATLCHKCVCMQRSSAGRATCRCRAACSSRRACCKARTPLRAATPPSPHSTSTPPTPSPRPARTLTSTWAWGSPRTAPPLWQPPPHRRRSRALSCLRTPSCPCPLAGASVASSISSLQVCAAPAKGARRLERREPGAQWRGRRQAQGCTGPASPPRQRARPRVARRHRGGGARGDVRRRRHSGARGAARLHLREGRAPLPRAALRPAAAHAQHAHARAGGAQRRQSRRRGGLVRTRPRPRVVLWRA